MEGNLSVDSPKCVRYLVDTILYTIYCKYLILKVSGTTRSDIAGSTLPVVYLVVQVQILKFN